MTLGLATNVGPTFEMLRSRFTSPVTRKPWISLLVSSIPNLNGILRFPPDRSWQTSEVVIYFN